MPGNKEGGEKIKQNGIAKYGSYEAYKLAMKELASKGGSALHPNKGFGSNKELASLAGTLGGRTTLANRQYKLSQATDRPGIKLTREK